MSKHLSEKGPKWSYKNMEFIVDKKPKSVAVGIRLTPESERGAWKIAKKRGVRKLGTICNELVVFALKVLKERGEI